MTHDAIVLPLRRAGSRDNTSTVFFETSCGAPYSSPDPLAFGRAGVDAVTMALALRYLAARAHRKTRHGRMLGGAVPMPALP